MNVLPQLYEEIRCKYVYFLLLAAGSCLVFIIFYYLIFPLATMLISSIQAEMNAIDYTAI